ncbi:MAG: septum formation family protein [Chloroflexota bacterium]
MSGTGPEPNVLRGPISPQPNVLRPISPADTASPPTAVAGEPPPSLPAEPPPKKGSPWLGWALRIGIVAAIAVGALIFRDRIGGAASDLRVGDCFDEPATLEEITDVQHRPCNEQHDGEVIFVGDHPDQDAYPADSAFEGFAFDSCVPAFESYVGRDWETDSEFDFGFFYPGAEAWAANDHEIACYVYRLDEQPLTQSVKAAGG